MMRAVFSSVKPMPAAAQPEYEFSIETTTGMSAPPIGMMRVTPRTMARMVMTQKVHVAAPRLVTSMTMRAMMAAKIAMLRTWRAGKMIGAPDMLPLSLAKAMTEPEKVIAPMATPIDISISDCMWMAPGSPMPKACGA